MNNATKAVKNPPPCQPQSDSRVLQKNKFISYKCNIELNYTKFNYCSHIINVEMTVDTLITFHTWIVLRRFPQSGRLILEEVSQLSFQSLFNKKHFIVQSHVLHFRAVKGLLRIWKTPYWKFSNPPFSRWPSHYGILISETSQKFLCKLLHS